MHHNSNVKANLEANGIDRQGLITNSKHLQPWLRVVGHVPNMCYQNLKVSSQVSRTWRLILPTCGPAVAPCHAHVSRGSVTRPGAHRARDKVVGSARPPLFAKPPSLPYIHVMVKETLHWSLTVPFGVPHALTEDDWYEGMFIPKGTVCLRTCAGSRFTQKCMGAMLRSSTRPGIWMRTIRFRCY